MKAHSHAEAGEHVKNQANHQSRPCESERSEHHPAMQEAGPDNGDPVEAGTTDAARGLRDGSRGHGETPWSGLLTLFRETWEPETPGPEGTFFAGGKKGQPWDAIAPW